MIKTRAFSLGALVVLACASCASMPGGARAPEWIFTTPGQDAVNTYFVGSASDASGDVAVASNDAAANLMASITQYIGVKISVSSSAEAKAALDSYSATITSSVRSSSKNQVSGFSVKERYVQTDKKTERVTVYVLASYATKELEREKARISAVFKEREDAVAKPEAEGKALESEGRAYDALRKYVEAAVAASGADIDNAAVKLERNVNNARSALSKLRFDVPASPGYKGFVGKEFPSPFVARIVSGEGASAPGVVGASVLLSYQRKSGTRLVSKTESLMSDASGRISFTPPPPDFVGKAKFGLELDLQSVVELLAALPVQYDSQRSALVDEIKAKAVSVPYEVVSAARAIPIAVALLDLDELGQASQGARAQASLIEALLKEKFDVKAVAISDDALIAMSEPAALAAASALRGIERVAFGCARIVEVRKDGENYLASGKAELKVLELATGRTLYQAERIATGLGSDEKSARASAYRELGLNAIAKDLLANLP